MTSVGLIINEKSNRARSVVSDILHVAQRFNVRAERLDGVTDLDKALIGMNRKNVDTLILAGGDGTIQAAFTDSINNRRFEHTPNFVALPCGMTNVIANDCGLKGSPVSSLDNFLWRRQKGEVQSHVRNLLSVKSGLSEPVHGFFLGAAAFHSAVKFSRSSIQSKGAKRSLALVASVGGYIGKVAFGAGADEDAVNMTFEEGGAPGAPASANQLLFMSTTLERLGAGIFPFWGKGPGGMTTMTVANPPKRLLRAAPAVLRSRSKPWFDDYGYRSWRSDEMVLRFDAPFVFDGEIFNSDPHSPTVLKASKNINFMS